LLLSDKEVSALTTAHVMIFGLGGVGSYAAEALGRMGIGRLTIVDKDKVEPGNINRQLCALTSTVGKSKAEVIKQRLLDINPDAVVVAIERFHLPKTPVTIPDDVDIVIDAVDTVAAKLSIICTCSARDIPVISCMGMGNRLDPTQVKLGDLFETNNCALSRVMRKELRKRGIGRLRCVYSAEDAVQSASAPPVKNGNRPAPGSVAYVPSVAGLLIAYDAVHTLINRTDSGDRR
jgi:tRNA A37 threonylcarbamoyladenosine dehydratase